MTEAAKELVRQQYAASGDAYVRSATHAAGDDLARLVAVIAPQSSDHLLDIATGGGHVAKAFAPLVAEVVASDLTPEMLDTARRFIESAGFANVRYERADAEALPFADKSFDVVTCRIAPHHFPHPDCFVAEVTRVLKPGGRFGLIDSVVPAGEMGALFNRFELARDPSHVRSLPAEEWIRLIEAAGLAVQSVEHFPKRHDFVDWTDRSRVRPEQRPAIARIVTDAGPDVAREFRLEMNGDTLVAFTDDKALFLAQRPY